MKKILLYILILVAAPVLLGSCTKDELDPKSIFEDEERSYNDFDLWLKSNYNDNFNIDYLYRYKDVETDLKFNLVATKLEKAKALAVLVKFLWLDAYEEVAGIHFIRTYTPRVIQLIGCPGYEGNGTIRLGTAEGGLKVTLYVANWLEPDNIDNLNEYFLNTMHHEFAHILHQNIDYPREFNTISTADYSPSAWFNRSEQESAKLGFITSYAGCEQQEDFVEIIARYVTYSEAKWNSVLAMAGTEGAAKINLKLSIAKRYMDEAWDIDLDVLRATLKRRYAEVPFLDLVNLN